jgi:hypothetical protein
MGIKMAVFGVVVPHHLAATGGRLIAMMKETEIPFERR